MIFDPYNFKISFFMVVWGSFSVFCFLQGVGEVEGFGGRGGVSVRVGRVFPGGGGGILGRSEATPPIQSARQEVLFD